MLMALLKGKLSQEQENMEDILTSIVFGLLKYLTPGEALLPFLREARTPEGWKPLADLPDETEVDYTFWPPWQEPSCRFCEPDVVLSLKALGGPEWLVAIEAKYLSPKSAEADYAEQATPTDQLAKEWDNLVFKVRAGDTTPVLIFLTADVTCPGKAISDSQKEYREKRHQEATIAWLSWRHMEVCVRGSTNPMLRDLGDSLRRLNLTFFKGFSSPSPLPPLSWRFEGLPVHFNWRIAPMPLLRWRFSPG